MRLPRRQASLALQLRRWCLSQLQALEERLRGAAGGLEKEQAAQEAGGAEEPGAGVAGTSPNLRLHLWPCKLAPSHRTILEGDRTPLQIRGVGLSEVTFSLADGDGDEASPATAGNTASSAQAVRPKAFTTRKSHTPQDVDSESRRRQHRAPSPSQRRRRGKDRQHRRPDWDQVRSAHVPGEPARAEVHVLEGASTPLECWHQRKAEAALVGEQAESVALLERIAHLEQQLHQLTVARKDQS